MDYRLLYRKFIRKIKMIMSVLINYYDCDQLNIGFLIISKTFIQQKRYMDLLQRRLKKYYQKQLMMHKAR